MAFLSSFVIHKQNKNHVSTTLIGFQTVYVIGMEFLSLSRRRHLYSGKERGETDVNGLVLDFLVLMTLTSQINIVFFRPSFQ